MRILMVTPYAPARDGIAVYALQEVGALRAEGHDVEVLSPWPSAAHHHADLRGWRGALRLRRLVRGYDRVVIQWHPDVFFENPATPVHRSMAALALGLVLRRSPHVEVRLHETDYRWGRGLSGWPTRMLWRGPARVAVHTEAQSRRLQEVMGVRPGRVEIVEHGAAFVRHTTADRATARQALGIDPDLHLFLSIGFIQPHKGFDRAVRAFARLDDPGARLAVVGSVRVDEEAAHEHADDLRQLIVSTPGVVLREGFLSDEAFDMWLVAADSVVLPYREIWSSSVVERALLHERPVIVSEEGGLPDQVRGRADAVVVADDDELVAAMAAERVRSGREGAVSRVPATTTEWGGPAADPASVMTRIRQLAAAERQGPSAGERRPADRLHVTAPLRRLPPLVPPPAVSGRPGATVLKRLVRRLIRWELDPVVGQVNRLRQATIEALERAQPPPE